ncbi:MAG: GNAT family N-acetyltransferase [Bacilli bacterium]|nr:GNAT family N-acetyltransferase [Bacilli bacterium]
MNIQLEKVLAEQKQTLLNLLEKFNYEFSQYDHIILNDEGLYGYYHLDSYFTDPNREAFFIRVDDELAGFVMINNSPDSPRPIVYSIAEFFVVYRHRNRGVAQIVVDRLFATRKGIWNIRFHPKNLVSVHLWTKIAKKYAGTRYEVIAGSEPYFDGSDSLVVLFQVR